MSETLVKCRCQHCSCNIEFDASGWQLGETQNVECPNCHLDTILFVPQSPIVAQNPKVEPPITSSQNITVEVKQGVSPLGIVSLVLGIIACLFCWIPFLGLFALPIAFVGMVLAVSGITMSCISKKTGFSFSIGGAVTCLVAFGVSIFMTGAVSILFAKATSQNSGFWTSEKSETWEKSGSVQNGDLRITIKSVSTGYTFVKTLAGDMGQTGPYLLIILDISNLSNSKKVDYTTWRGEQVSTERDYAELTDDNGNVYKRINFGLNTTPYEDNIAIYPSQTASDTLAFEMPVQHLKWLHLELPAANFGGAGMIRFEIGKQSIN